MRYNDDKVWAGSSSSFWSVKQAEETFQARLAAGWNDTQDDDEEDDPEDEHDLLQVVGNIGVIHISGGLVNDDAWYLKYYGLTGYPHIKAALDAAARNANVKHILLNIDSGGGSVAGCQDTGDLIRLIHTELKPVSAFTGGSMASAAYWLGSSAGRVYAAETALVGSIGVIATHKEYSKMYQEAGIGVTVVRSGQYKALANSMEPLSKEGEAQLQALVDATSKVFTRHVSKMRGRTEEYVDSTMGQGREFVGAAAADVGLVDGITSLDALLSELQRQYIDTQPGRLDTQPKQVGGFGASTATQTENVMLKEELEKLKAEQNKGNGDETAAAAQTAGTQEGVKNEEANTLSALLEKATAEVVDLRVKLINAETAARDAIALIDPMKAVLVKSLSSMRIALGGVAVEANQSAAQLLAEHETVSAEFAAKFPVGGVAAVDAAQGDKTQKTRTMSGLEAARLNAVLNKK